MTEQQTGNFNVKERRQSLFCTLEHVLAVAKTKFDKEKASNSERRAWGRLIVQAIESYGRLLLSEKLETMEKRIAVLEEVRNGEFKI
jgi:hypothetical protein